MQLKPQSTGVVSLLLTCLILPVRADEISEKGRNIFNNYQHAVVTVQVVQKVSYSAQGRASAPNESRQELTGTVVDPSGLTVLALSACDPTEMYRRMMPERYANLNVEAEISDIKILLHDGTEMPAEIVLRDKDLDLAFIRPKTKPVSPMVAVDLSKSGQAQVLDQVITLNRLNKATGRAYSASVERICGVVRKPRTFYLPDSLMTATALGSPAFTLEGNFLGLNVMRTVNSSDGGMNNFRPEGMTSIFLPAEDILKAAKQAPEAKGDEKKEESKTSEPAEKKEAKMPESPENK